MHKEMTNKKFGRLTVVKYLHTDKHRRSVWLCACTCGKQTSVRADRLNSGVTLSCGCLLKEQAAINGRKNWTGFEDMSGEFLSSIRSTAKRKGVCFNVTNKDIWNQYIIQNKKCALSGIDISFARNRKEKQTASLDRQCSSTGYEIGNIQWVHKHINFIKGILSNFEILYWVDIICNPIKYDTIYNPNIAIETRHKNYNGYGNISMEQYISYKQNAKCRQLEFDISIKDCWELFIKQNGRCAMTNLNLTTSDKNNSLPTASIDRIDNNIGYIISNIRWVHKIVNKMKWTFNDQDFMQYCCLIHKHNTKTYDISMIGGHH